MNAIATATPTAQALPSQETMVDDTVLAEMLGYEHARDIRRLIKRHLPMLETLGPSLHRDAMVEIGSGAKRKVAAYALNEAQAIFIVASAQTKRATAMRAEMAEVLALFRRGGLVAADATAAAALVEIKERGAIRLGLCGIEEKEARRHALRFLRR